MFSLGVAGLLMSFGSCKKDYTCTCTASSNVPGIPPSITTSTITDTKSNAEEKCKQGNATATTGNVTATKTCEITD
jgi:hypothetical protein